MSGFENKVGSELMLSIDKYRFKHNIRGCQSVGPECVFRKNINRSIRVLYVMKTICFVLIISKR